MKNYFVLIKATGKRLTIDRGKKAEMLLMIQNLTHLNPEMAEVILNGGKSIEHPHYQFTAADAKPAANAKLKKP